MPKFAARSLSLMNYMENTSLLDGFISLVGKFFFEFSGTIQEIYRLVSITVSRDQFQLWSCSSFSNSSVTKISTVWILDLSICQRQVIDRTEQIFSQPSLSTIRYLYEKEKKIQNGIQADIPSFFSYLYFHHHQGQGRGSWFPLFHSFITVTVLQKNSRNTQYSYFYS